MSESNTKNKQPARREMVLDAELEEYRNLLDVPTRFGEGFTWISVAGALFHYFHPPLHHCSRRVF